MNWNYKIKNAFNDGQPLKRNWDERNIKGSLLECFWRVKDAVVPKKISEIKFNWDKNDD